MKEALIVVGVIGISLMVVYLAGRLFFAGAMESLLRFQNKVEKENGDG